MSSCAHCGPKRGIGSAMIFDCLEIVGGGRAPVFVLGDPEFYRRFGFVSTQSPFCPSIRPTRILWRSAGANATRSPSAMRTSSTKNGWEQQPAYELQFKNSMRRVSLNALLRFLESASKIAISPLFRHSMPIIRSTKI